MITCRKCNQEKEEDNGKEFGDFCPASSSFYVARAQAMAPYKINTSYFVCTPCILQALGVQP